MKNRDEIRIKIYGKPNRVNLFLSKLDDQFFNVSKGLVKKDPVYKDIKLYVELNPSNVRYNPMNATIKKTSRFQKIWRRLKR